MIRLNESETEFLLFVPFRDKERAKGIDGRRWDPDRGCWVYPKTARVFDEIIGEFGEDMEMLSVSRPEADSPVAPSLEEENTNLREELADIRKTVELLVASKVNTETSEIHKIRRALVDKDQELQRAKEDIRNLSGKLEKALDETGTSREESERLRAQLAAKNPGSKSEELVQTLLVVASEATGGNRQFLSLIERVKNPERFPLEFAIAVEEYLRERLQVGTGPASLHDLISQAADAEILSRDAVDLAHIIRKQRNLFAHTKADRQTGPAREFLTLFAASLLWRDLK